MFHVHSSCISNTKIIKGNIQNIEPPYSKWMCQINLIYNNNNNNNNNNNLTKESVSRKYRVEPESKKSKVNNIRN